MLSLDSGDARLTAPSARELNRPQLNSPLILPTTADQSPPTELLQGSSSTVADTLNRTTVGNWESATYLHR